MRFFVLAFSVLVLSLSASAVDYQFKTPIESEVELQENGNMLNIKISFVPAKLFSKGNNERVEQIHSKLLLGQTLLKYKKAPTGMQVSYSGSRIIGRGVDDFDNVYFVYEVPTDGIALVPAENSGDSDLAPKKMRTMNEFLKSLPLHGHTLRIRSDIVASVDSYVVQLKNLLEESKNTTEEAFLEKISKLSEDINNNFDKESLRKKFSADIKISSSDLKTLMALVESARHNLEIIQTIILTRFDQNKLKRDNPESSEIKNLEEEIKSLKSKIKKLKE